MEVENEGMARKIERMEAKTSKVEEGLVGVEKEVVTGMEKAKEEVKKDMAREMFEREERSANVHCEDILSQIKLVSSHSAMVPRGGNGKKLNKQTGRRRC